MPRAFSRNLTGNNLLSPIDEAPKDGENYFNENNRQLLLNKDVDPSMNDLPMFASNGLVRAEDE